MNNIISNYKHCFRNYLNFKATTTEKEVWMFVLANLIVSLILSGITILINRYILVGADYSIKVSIFSYIFTVLVILQSVYIVSIIIPSFALVVRCLRNSVSGGILYLLALVPIFSVHILLIIASVFWYQ